MSTFKSVWAKLFSGNWVIYTTKELWLLVGTIAAVVGLALFVLFSYIEPPPPKVVRISTGSTTGAYYKYAKAYAEKLKRHGINLEVIESSGTAENLKRLNDSSANISVAFVQTGVATDAENEKLESLASVAFEPVWVLSKPTSKLEKPVDLKDKRVVIGPDGSGTQPVAREILKANGIDANSATLIPKNATDGLGLLEANQADAMITIAAPSAPIIEKAFAAGLTVMEFEQSAAYVRRYPWMAKLTLPRGSANLATNTPAKDLEMIGAVTNLVTRADLNPAIAFLLLDIASEVHSAPGAVHDLKQFPNEKNLQFTQSAESVRFFKTGRPFLQRYLPFWLANLIERMLVSIVPILAIGIPLLKAIPSFFEYREKARLLQLYEDIFRMERDPTTARKPVQEQLDFLDQIDERLQKLKIGAAHHPSIYSLRSHLNESRQKLLTLTAKAATAP
jgi:TRAP transporter TAXI family solute receptor